MKSGIYIIKNTINKKVYIGSAVNLDKRFSQHKNNLLKNKHCNAPMQNFVNKYGFDTLSFNILEEVKNKKDLIKREQKYIDSYKFKDLFNICKVAGSSLGTKASAATKKKMSESQKGKNIGNTVWLGKNHTATTKEKMSESAKGNTNGLGFKHTAASRKKMSESQKGNTNWLGKKHTEATRKKISEIQKGNTNWLGKTHSTASRKKMSESKLKTVLIFKDNILIDTIISLAATAKKYNIHKSSISAVCLGKRNHTRGYTMIYE